VEFCTSAAVISASDGSRVALSQHLLSFLFACVFLLQKSRLLYTDIGYPTDRRRDRQTDRQTIAVGTTAMSGEAVEEATTAII